MSALLQLAAGGLAADRVWRLLAQHGDATRAVRAIVHGKADVTEPVRAAVARGASLAPTLAAAGITFVTPDDAAYPAAFADLAVPPPYLFLRGALGADPRVAIVGTRRCSAYGRRVARAYGEALARAGVPVVSGLARGVDGAAHRGTLVRGGETVAVLGSGIDVWYPAEHAELGEQIVAEGGAVLSEYPPGARPLPWRFPIRNRLIAALAEVVVVVEAAETGGALITARQALDLGREVFATPGDVDRPSSAGCNRLIRDGAMPVFDPGDLIEAVDVMFGRLTLRAPVADTAHPDRWVWDAIGPIGRRYEALVDATNRPISEVLMTVARLESAGLVDIEEGMVRRTTDELA